MRTEKVAVLTSKDSWFATYAKEFAILLQKKGFHSKFFNEYEKIPESFNFVFILSYSNIIDRKLLTRHTHNIVIHGSGLPKGRGWSPISWQILEGRNKIPITLFEASEGIDEGRIYIKDRLCFKGDELNDEIREAQVRKTIELCLRFLNEYRRLKPQEQKGRAAYYKKRAPEDSMLDINKALKKQFNLLRIVNNKEYPAFFYYKGNKYILEIHKDWNKARSSGD